MTIKVSLGNDKDIQKASNEILAYAKSLSKKCNIFLERVGKLGVDIAKAYVRHYSIPSEIGESIKLEKGDMVVSGGTIQIIVDSENAIYWEYGTGMIGEQNPHPNPDIWIYDIHKHGQGGWVYTAEQGQLTQWSKKIKDKDLYHTKGMPAQPFMYSTYKDLLYTNEIMRIAKEVFR